MPRVCVLASLLLLGCLAAFPLTAAASAAASADPTALLRVGEVGACPEGWPVEPLGRAVQIGSGLHRFCLHVPQSGVLLAAVLNNNTASNCTQTLSASLEAAAFADPARCVGCGTALYETGCQCRTLPCGPQPWYTTYGLFTVDAESAAGASQSVLLESSNGASTPVNYTFTLLPLQNVSDQPQDDSVLTQLDAAGVPAASTTALPFVRTYTASAADYAGAMQVEVQMNASSAAQGAVVVYVRAGAAPNGKIFEASCDTLHAAGCAAAWDADAGDLFVLVLGVGLADGRADYAIAVAPAPAADTDGGLSAGATAGVVFGCICGSCLLILAGAVFLVRRRRRRRMAGLEEREPLVAGSS